MLQKTQSGFSRKHDHSFIQKEKTNSRRWSTAKKDHTWWWVRTIGFINDELIITIPYHPENESNSIYLSSMNLVKSNNIHERIHKQTSATGICILFGISPFLTIHKLIDDSYYWADRRLGRRILKHPGKIWRCAEIEFGCSYFRRSFVLLYSFLIIIN